MEDINDIVIDPEEVIHFDIEEIDKESIDEAVGMVDNLATFYYDDKFMCSHPSFKKRVDTDLESLRVMLKLRKADEKVQDQLMKSIAANPNNASLYKSLADIQKVIISLTTKINELVTGLQTMMRGYQQELNFDGNGDGAPPEESETVSVDVTVRGSKDFIRLMKKSSENED